MKRVLRCRDAIGTREHASSVCVTAILYVSSQAIIYPYPSFLVDRTITMLGSVEKHFP